MVNNCLAFSAIINIIQRLYLNFLKVNWVQIPEKNLHLIYLISYKQHVSLQKKKRKKQFTCLFLNYGSILKIKPETNLSVFSKYGLKTNIPNEDIMYKNSDHWPIKLSNAFCHWAKFSRVSSKEKSFTTYITGHPSTEDAKH